MSISTKIKSILVAQAKPESDKTPYSDLLTKYKVKLDYHNFIDIESVASKDFRKERINILEHTAVVLTSKNATDYFFNLCKELRVEIPETMKYFCSSEAIALYLQKFVTYRKRKISFGKQRIDDLIDLIVKSKDDKFLLPVAVSDTLDATSLLFEKNKVDYTRAPIFQMVHSDLSNLEIDTYDIIVLFSASSVASLIHNFPKFKKSKINLAVFGEKTAEAVKIAKLKATIYAPTPEFPSMVMAIEDFVKKSNK